MLNSQAMMTFEFCSKLINFFLIYGSKSGNKNDKINNQGQQRKDGWVNEKLRVKNNLLD